MSASLPPWVTSPFVLIEYVVSALLFSMLAAVVALVGGEALCHGYDYLNERVRHAPRRASYKLEDPHVLFSTIIVLALIVGYVGFFSNQNVNRDPNCHLLQSTDIEWNSGTAESFVNGTHDVYVCDHNFDVPAIGE